MYWIRTDKEYRPKRLKIWGLGLFLALQINALSHNFHIIVQELANIT